jgi:O-antigen ligase
MILGLIVVALGLPLVALSIYRPMRTIVPLYAGLVPIASEFRLSVPLPPPFNTLSSVLGGLVVVACLGHVILYRRGRVPTPPVTFWLIFLGWATLSSLWAVDFTPAWNTLLLATPLMFLMVVISLMPVNEEEFDITRVAIILSGAIVGAYALALLFTGRALPAHGVSQRLSIKTNPSETDPNILAASLLLPLSISIERYLLGGSRLWRSSAWRWLGGVTALLIVVAVLFTGSRGGVLSSMVAIVLTVVYCWRLPEGRKMIRRTLATLAVVAALGTSAAVADTLVTKVTNSSGPSEFQHIGQLIKANSALRRLWNTENRGSGRLDLWIVGYRACQARCGWGAGLGNFQQVYNEAFAFSSITNDVGFNRPAHNIYLGLSVELGFIGLTLLALALLAEWLALSKEAVWRLAPSLKAALAAVLVAEIFLSAIWFKYFWLTFLFIRMAENAAASRTSEPVAFSSRSLSSRDRFPLIPRRPIHGVFLPEPRETPRPSVGGSDSELDPRSK